MLRSSALFVLCFATLAVRADVVLDPAAATGYDTYLQAVRARMTPGQLRFESQSDKAKAQSRLKAGEMVVSKIETNTKLAEAMLHHSVAAVFIPGATIDRALKVTEDYARYQQIYKPDIQQSRLIEKNGHDARIFLQIFKKKATAATLNTEHNVRFQRIDATRAFSHTEAYRIAELIDSVERPPGNDRGFLWRLNSFWTFVERDGGLYFQIESVSLSRDVPAAVGWLLRSFLVAVHRELLEHMVLSTKKEVLAGMSR